jgi:integrase
MASIAGLDWDPKTGKGRVRKVVRGVRIQRRFEASTRDEAEAAYYRILAELDTPVTEQRTFMAAATHYLQTERKKSISRDAECLEQIMPFIGRLTLDRIHQGTIEPYITKRKADGVKSGTVVRELAVVRRVLTLAARFWRDAEGRPWMAGAPPLLRFPNWDDKRHPYPLNADEQYRLLSHLPEHLALMTRFALNTGMRQNNVCYLRWEWERQIPELGGRSVFLIPGRSMKNKFDAIIPINRRASVILDKVRGQHDQFVFTFEGRPIQRINNSGWRRAWRMAELPTEDGTMGGPHNLRHTFARQLRASMVPHESIKALLSHVDGDVTLRYAPSEIQALLDIVDNLTEQKTVLRVVA